MTDVETLKRYLQRALALAHAALEDPTARRVEEARAFADDVLTLTARCRHTAATLADGHALVGLAHRLRTVLEALDGVTAGTPPPAPSTGARI